MLHQYVCACVFVKVIEKKRDQKLKKKKRVKYFHRQVLYILSGRKIPRIVSRTFEINDT